MRYLSPHSLFAIFVSCLMCQLAFTSPLEWKLVSPSPRNRTPLVADEARGVIVMFGGQRDANVVLSNETWEWNGVRWVLRPVTGPSARCNHAMAYDPIRKVVVLFGGVIKDSFGNVVQNGETWEWNGNSWSLRAVSGPKARSMSAMCFDGVRGKMLLFGGGSDGGYLSDTWEWDGTTWAQLNQVGPSARAGHAMCFDPVRQNVVLFGNPDSFDAGWVWTWNGSNWSKNLAEPPPRRWGHVLVFDASRGKMLMFGGRVLGVFSDTPSDELWEWDGFSWLKRAESGPSKRYLCGGAFLPGQQQLVMFGGYSGSRLLGDLWSWTAPNTWKPIDHGQPNANTFYSLSYDSRREKTVLFGGLRYPGSSTYLAETWEWDGRVWASRGVQAGLGARAFAGMAFDRERGVTVMFGGLPSAGSSARLDDTWEWDGTIWIRRFVAGPSKRSDVAMTYDTQRRVCVLFGGRTESSPTYSAETWEWNGVSWILRAIDGPPAAAASGMVYDSRRGVCVLFGGYNSSPLGETWEWDGIRWTFRTNAGPSPRFGAGIAFDSRRARTVLYGGYTGSYLTLADTWEWDGEVWSRRFDQLPRTRLGMACAFDSARGKAVLGGGYAKDFEYYGTDFGFFETWELGVDCPADLNADVAVNDEDFAVFVHAYDLMSCDDPEMTSGCPADFNWDGVVDDSDFEIFVSAYRLGACDQSVAQVIEQRDDVARVPMTCGRFKPLSEFNPIEFDEPLPEIGP